MGVRTRALGSICSLGGRGGGCLEEAVPGLSPELSKTQPGEGRGKAFQREGLPGAQGL